MSSETIILYLPAYLPNILSAFISGCLLKCLLPKFGKSFTFIKYVISKFEWLNESSGAIASFFMVQI